MNDRLSAREGWALDRLHVAWKVQIATRVEVRVYVFRV